MGFFFVVNVTFENVLLVVSIVEVLLILTEKHFIVAERYIFFVRYEN